MKKIAILTVVIFCLGMAVVFAANPAPAPATMTVTGVIIDNHCASAQKPENLATFVKTHTKDCALKCADSGYEIFDGKALWKFDKDSNAKIVTFLKQKDSTTQVVVDVKKIGDTLSLVSINNLMTVTGVIIDNKCASAQKPENLAAFVKTHPKDCAIKCADSGYEIFDGKALWKFDKDSNAKIVTFLKQKDSTTQVVVDVKKVGDVLSLVSIKNQAPPAAPKK